jgi:hypothetical protein
MQDTPEALCRNYPRLVINFASAVFLIRYPRLQIVHVYVITIIIICPRSHRSRSHVMIAHRCLRLLRLPLPLRFARLPLAQLKYQGHQIEAVSIYPNLPSRNYSAFTMSAFYNLKAPQPGNKTFDFEELRGKVVLIVNVASQWCVHCFTQI